MLIDDDEEFERNWVWLGMDREGRLAIFQSFGIGVLHDGVKESLEDAETVVEYSDTFLKSEQGYCSGSIVEEGRQHDWFSRVPSPQFKKNHADYLDGAVRRASCGLFVFDAKMRPQGPSGYFQVARPNRRRMVDSLPLDIQAIVRRSTFFGLSFPQALLLSIEDIKSA